MWKILNKALAATVDGGPTSVNLQIGNPLKATSITQLLENLLDAVIEYGVAIAAFFLIYSGFMFVTARGNEDKIKKARQSLQYTVIGSAILLGAWVIITVIAETVKSL